MGKDLRGKELGVGISQRKDGYYTARCTDRTGKRHQRYFQKLQECRNWIAEMNEKIKYGDIYACSNPSVSALFSEWIENVKRGNVRDSSLFGYDRLFVNHAEEMIGNMPIGDVKPIHCQAILNSMVKQGFAENTISHLRMVLAIFFDYALENGYIKANPITKSVKARGKKSEQREALTVEEQKLLIETIQGLSQEQQIIVALQTGMRIGELRGLKWSDIDLKKKVIHVNRTVYRLRGKWIVEKPKTESGKRTIPLTKIAEDALLAQREKNKKLPVVKIQWKDNVFLSQEGNVCSETVMKRFWTCVRNRNHYFDHISMHVLRHTFATRCIEAGMKPKTLQMILGHSNIKTTMDLYVHVTENEKHSEMKKIETYLAI